ncbi:hypothetical protein ACIHAX_30085 [Nocardia sp. NPDC051929]|uniref:hypothetical protein n=1 Tax=unclassified Nocardia TaxID=2637762 RepID=UPI003444AC5E
MIRLAKLTGVVMTDGGELGNRLRGIIAPRIHRLPGLARVMSSGETPPLRRSALVAALLLWRGSAGRLLPNDRLEDGRRLDEVADRPAPLRA